MESALGAKPPGTTDPNTGIVNEIGGYYISNFGFYATQSEGDLERYFYLDQVSVSSTPLPIIQTFAKSVTSQGFAPDDIIVTKNYFSLNEIHFVINFITSKCGATIDVITVGESKDRYSEVTSGENGLSLSVEISRLSENSPPISGWYMLWFSDYPAVNISLSMNDTELEELLRESFSPLATSSPISISGESTCNSFSKVFQFLGKAYI